MCCRHVAVKAAHPVPIHRDSSPESGHRCGEQPLAKGNDCLPVVENDAELEVAAAGVSQFLQAFEIARTDRGCCLDLDSDERAGAAFDHDIDLILVLVPVMMQGAVLTEPFRLLQYLGKDEGFEQGPENRAVLRDARGGGAERRGEQAGIEEMEFWRLYQPLEPVAQPRFHAAHDEQLRNIVSSNPDYMDVQSGKPRCQTGAGPAAQA